MGGSLPLWRGQRGLRPWGQAQPLIGGAIPRDTQALGVMGNPHGCGNRLQYRTQLRGAPNRRAARLFQRLLAFGALGDIEHLG
jgi:hypothetical protein